MKMKKLTAAIMTAIMSVSLLGMTAFAAQSPITTGIAKGEATDASGNAVTVTVTEEKTAEAWEAAGVPADTAKLLADINTGTLKGTEALKELYGDNLAAVTDTKGTKVDLSKASILTGFVEISVPDNATFPLKITFESASVSGKDAKDIYFAHVVTKDGKSTVELIPADSVSGTKITGTFDSLSPVAVVYTGSADTASLNSAKTGDTSQPIMYAVIAAAALCGIVGVVAYKKRRRL